MLAHEGAESILKAEAGEEGGFLAGGLAVEIELGGPPAGDAVFQFAGDCTISVAFGRLAEGGFGFDFEVSWLFEVVRVGDEIGLFLGLQGLMSGGRERELEGESGQTIEGRVSGRSRGRIEPRATSLTDIRLNESHIEYKLRLFWSAIGYKVVCHTWRDSVGNRESLNRLDIVECCL